ncbi:DcaP family trimeric outer membrane transporter [Marinobacter sp. VGCF2001]|uniref:DcaP family trimeric outer membrane transporter n=1 Tax=Marinobacter sp. VGCF2001 TaxID=3417189 RepID=UPI003CEE91D5
MAIRATAAATVFGMAGQAGAVSFGTGGYEANLYGFARVAASYDIDEDIASGGQSGNFSSISTGSGDTADGHFGMDANTSRIGLSVMSPQDVKVVVEFDFDNNDSLEPRLRHAYGEYQGVLIGRNWSNYNSFVGNTSGLDFDSLPGLAGTQGRTEQIRYTSGPFSVSLEEPANSVGNGLDADGDPELKDTKSGTPAFTARMEDSAGGLAYSAAVMVKQTAYDTGSDDDSAIGYAAFLAGKFAVTDMISIQGAINYGDGATGYVYRAGGNFGQYDAYVDADDDIETVEAYGGAIGASVSLGGGRSVNLGYGMATVDLDDAVDDTALTSAVTDTNTMAFLNYQWSPVEKVKMGVEYAYLETETQGGDDGDANRLMFLAQYSF